MSTSTQHAAHHCVFPHVHTGSHSSTYPAMFALPVAMHACALPLLLAGLPVNVALLGGSVSLVSGHTPAVDAGWASMFHKWLELTFTPCGDEFPHGSGDGGGGWLAVQRPACMQALHAHMGIQRSVVWGPSTSLRPAKPAGEHHT
jgi:hypothetical protein